MSSPSSSSFGSVFAPVIAEEGRKEGKEEEGEALSLFAPISRLFPDVTAGDG